MLRRKAVGDMRNAAKNVKMGVEMMEKWNSNASLGDSVFRSEGSAVLVEEAE